MAMRSAASYFCAACSTLRGAFAGGSFEPPSRMPLSLDAMGAGDFQPRRKNNKGRQT
jgi:hypothetical protein